MKNAKNIIKLLLCLFIFNLTSTNAKAQSISTEGTEFWVSFMYNGYETNNNGGDAYQISQLIISSKQNCTGTISNPFFPDWAINFTVEANGIEVIDIPSQYAYPSSYQHGTPVNKGLFVQTSAPVSVYCANAARFSFDASYVLPLPAIGHDYIVQTYDQSDYDWDHTSAFLIIATEDGETTIDITPTVKTLDDHLAGETFSITLQKGQVYQVRSNCDYSGWGTAESRDLSGTRVTARDCKKIAVFNGNNLTQVPSDIDADSDCIFEQAMPIKAWGKKFIVTASLGRAYNDYVKITSAHDGNVINKNGVLLATLDANESRIFELWPNDKSCFIEATHSCAVYMYNHSKDYDTENGAPSMVWIAPIEQRIEELTFSTFNDLEPNHVSVDKHYINIIVQSEDINNVILDGIPIESNQFESVNGTDEYKFHRREISHDRHHLSCPNGFNAHVYGFGHATGYAYMVGSKAEDLSTVLLIDGVEVHEGDQLEYCAKDIINFHAETNQEGIEVEWSFGDNTPNSQNSQTQHTYLNEGTYPVTLTINIEDPCLGTSTTTTNFTIKVHPTINEPIIENICWEGGNNPMLYTENGFNVEYFGAGIYYDTVVGETEFGCEYIRTLTLYVVEPNQTTDFGTVILCRATDPEYVWEVNGQTYTESGPQVYEDNSALCPQTYLINLEFYDKPEPITIDTTACGSFYWHITGHTYESSENNIHGYVENPALEGCGQDYYLNLTIYDAEGEDPLELYSNETEPLCDSKYITWEVNDTTTYGITVYADTSFSFTHSDNGCIRKHPVKVEGMEYTPRPEIKSYDPLAHYPITATEFLVNRYTFFIADSLSNKSHWDIDKCEWAITHHSWRIVPSDDKLSCLLYPMDYLEDTIWLRFTAVNQCDSITTSYFLLPSFYDIEEHDAHSSAVSIAPNPNNGQMELRFENMEGRIDVIVCNTTGSVVDHFIINARPNPYHFPYSMKRLSGGVYFFVFNDGKHIITKKAVIIP